MLASSFGELLQIEEGLEPLRKKLQEHSAVFFSADETPEDVTTFCVMYAY